MKSIGKRGTHVEMIISFSIFILFISSLFFIIQPAIREKGSKEIVLDSLEREILKNISSNVTLTFIKLKNTYAPTGNCIKFEETSGGGWVSGENVVVKGANDEIIASTFEYPVLKIDRTKNDKFFKVYSSPEKFEIETMSFDNCAIPAVDTDFSIDYIKTEEYVFESNIVDLNSSYASSYESLKTFLDVSLEDEFGFVFVNSTGKIFLKTKDGPTARNIYSREIPVIYFDNQSKIVDGIIRLNMW